MVQRQAQRVKKLLKRLDWYQGNPIQITTPNLPAVTKIVRSGQRTYNGGYQ